MKKKSIIILDHASNSVFIHEYSSRTKKSDLELVIKFGHRPSQCEWMCVDMDKEKCMLIINSQNYFISPSISSLTKRQYFYITLIAQLNSDLVDEKIITPTQKSQIEKYIQNKIK